MPKDFNKEELENYLNLLKKEQDDDFCKLARLVNLDPKLDFMGADLQGTNLTQQELVGANFESADLQNATFTYAQLNEAKFADADLRDTNFSYSNLENADLSCADLRGAKFRGAILRGAKLRDCALENADFREANLDGIDWAGVKVDNAIFDENDLNSEKNRGLKEDGSGKSEYTLADRSGANDDLMKATDDQGATKPASRRTLDSPASRAEDVVHSLREARWLVGCLAVFVLGCVMIYMTPHLPELDNLQKTTLQWAGVVAMLAGVMLAAFGSIVAIKNHFGTPTSQEQPGTPGSLRSGQIITD